MGAGVKYAMLAAACSHGVNADAGFAITGTINIINRIAIARFITSPSSTIHW
jgi:hypothetical protein